MKGLNVFTLSFLPWGYLPNWKKNFKILWCRFKYAWQRATKGYCDYDLYELNDFFLQLIPDTLNTFADRTHSAPDEYCDKNTGSIEDWQNKVREIATHFSDAKELDTIINNLVFKPNSDISHQLIDARDREFKIGWEQLWKVYFDLWD